MIKVLVCDDDVTITAKVKDLLQKIQKNNNIDFEIDVRNNGDFVRHQKVVYDIAIVDIEMPEITGLELSEKLKEYNNDVIVIILTSFSDYLDKAMKISVFRYLSKPVDEERFYRNFIDAIVYHGQISKQIIIENCDKVYFIKTKDILYIENLKHGSIIVTKNQKFKTSKKPQQLCDEISQPHCFIYSHKSFVVNLQNVINFDKNLITFETGSEAHSVPCISQRKYAEFKKAFYSFVGGI